MPEFTPPSPDQWEGPAQAAASASQVSGFVPPPVSAWEGPAPAGQQAKSAKPGKSSEPPPIDYSHMPGAVINPEDTMNPAANRWLRDKFPRVYAGLEGLLTAIPRGVEQITHGATTPNLKPATRIADVIEGSMTAGAPTLLAVPGMGLRAIATTGAAIYGGGKVGKGAKEVAKSFGADPETARAVEDVTSLAAGGAIAHYGPKLVGAAGSGAGISKVNPDVALVRVYNPGTADSGFSERAPLAARDIRDFGGIKTIKTNEDVIAGGRAARNHLQDQGLEPWIARARDAGTLVSTEPLVKATQDALSLSMKMESPEQAANILQNAREAYSGVSLPVDTVRQLLKEKNAELDAFYDKSIGKQNAAAMSGTPQAIVQAQRDTLADMLYKALDEANAGAGPREIQKRTGNVISLLEAAQKQRNAIIGEKPVSKGEAISRLVTKPIEGAGKAWHGNVEAGIAGALHPIQGPSDAMIARTFRSLGPRQPLPLPQTVAPPVGPTPASSAAPVAPVFAPAAAAPAAIPVEEPIAAQSAVQNATPAPPLSPAPALTAEGRRAMRQTELEQAFSQPTPAERQAALNDIFSKPRTRDEFNVIAQQRYGRPTDELSQEEFASLLRDYVKEAFAKPGTAAPPIPEAASAGTGTPPPPLAEAPPEPASAPAPAPVAIKAATPEVASQAGQIAANPPAEPAEPVAAAEPVAPTSGSRRSEVTPGLESGEGLMAPGVFAAPKSQAEVPAPDREARMNTADLSVDPERFQYKIDAVGKGGVSNKYAGAKYEEKKAGTLQVWFDPADGKTYVINGHHRHGIAVGSGAATQKVKFIEAPNAAEARIQGAIQNIAENQGTALDAAKLFRDSGISGQQAIEKYGLSPNAQITRQGLEMAKLTPQLFKMAIDQEISPEQGALIGRELGDQPEHQDSLAKLLAKKAAEGSEYSLKQLANRIGLAKGAGVVESDQGVLFGGGQDQQSSLDATASFMDKIRDRLSADKRLFGAVSKSANAEKLAGAGNVLESQKNKSIADEAKNALAVYDRLKFRAGPINQALLEAGKEIANGARPREIEEKYYDQVRQAVADELPGAANSRGASPAGNPPPNGVGGEDRRPGVAGEPEGTGSSGSSFDAQLGRRGGGVSLHEGQAMFQAGKGTPPPPIFGDEANPGKNVIARYPNADDGVEAVVSKHHSGGFGVSVRDMDADQYVGATKIFPKQEDAIAYAEKIGKQAGLFGEENKALSKEQAAAEAQAKQKLEADRLAAEFNSPINAGNRRSKLKKAAGPVQEDMFALPDDSPKQGGFDFQRDLFEKGVKKKLSAPFDHEDVSGSIEKSGFRYFKGDASKPARIYVDDTTAALFSGISSAMTGRPARHMEGVALDDRGARIAAAYLRKGPKGEISEKAKAKLGELADQLADALDDNPHGVAVINAEGRMLWDIRDTAAHERAHVAQYELMGPARRALFDYDTAAPQMPYFREAQKALGRAGYDTADLAGITREILSAATERRYNKATGLNSLGLTQEKTGQLVKAILDRSVAVHGDSAYDLVKDAAPNFQRELVGPDKYDRIRAASRARAGSESGQAPGSPQERGVRAGMGKTARPPID